MNHSGFIISFKGKSALENVQIDESLLFLPSSQFAFRTWTQSPSLILGRFQNPLYEINYSEFARDPVPTVQRFSGGGTVYHDEGVINVALSVPGGWFQQHDESIKTVQGRIGYLSSLIQSVLDTRTHRRVTADSYGSLFINQKKILGCAAFVKEGRFFYHASLLFDADLKRLERLIQWHPQKAVHDSLAVSSRRRPVTNFSMYSDIQQRQLESHILNGLISKLGIHDVNRVTSVHEYSETIQRDYHSIPFQSKGVDHV